METGTFEKKYPSIAHEMMEMEQIALIHKKDPWETRLRTMKAATEVVFADGSRLKFGRGRGIAGLTAIQAQTN